MPPLFTAHFKVVVLARSFAIDTFFCVKPFIAMEYITQCPPKNVVGAPPCVSRHACSVTSSSVVLEYQQYLKIGLELMARSTP
jgi:hypothetical protein